MENQTPPLVMKTLTLDETSAAKKRECSCNKGQYNEKTGELIPPYELPSAKLKQTLSQKRTIQVAFPPEFTTQEMRDAQHGKSVGIKTKLDHKAFTNDLDSLVGNRLKKIEKNN